MYWALKDATEVYKKIGCTVVVVVGFCNKQNTGIVTGLRHESPQLVSHQQYPTGLWA